MCSLIYLHSFFTWILFHGLNQSLSSNFSIECLVFCAKILRGCSSFNKLFRKLFIVFEGININEECFVELKDVCNLMFS